MDRLPEKLFAAIEAGDVGAVGRLCALAGEDVERLLTARREGSGLVRRPGNGRELYVLRPTPLLLAVTLWYADVVDAVAAFKVTLSSLPIPHLRATACACVGPTRSVMGDLYRSVITPGVVLWFMRI